MFFTYVLYSESSDLFYIGQTDQLEERILQHNGAGNYRSWTARHRPWKLFYHETFPSRREAIIRERELKSGQGRAFLRNLLKNIKNSK